MSSGIKMWMVHPFFPDVFATTGGMGKLELIILFSVPIILFFHSHKISLLFSAHIL